MREGRAKLEESAIIVHEVAKELKVKEEKIQTIAAKLMQMIFTLEGKIEDKEASSQEVVELADVSQFPFVYALFARWSTKRSRGWLVGRNLKKSRTASSKV